MVFSHMSCDPFCYAKSFEDSLETRKKHNEISEDLIDDLKHGFVEVDINELEAPFHDFEKGVIRQGVMAFMLTTFCRGGCKECALDAKSYTKYNNKVFALDPLVQYLSNWQGIGDLMLYDASDPLDYPYLLALLREIEKLDNIHRVKIATSCPSGTEQVFEEILNANFSKVMIKLSLLPSNQKRLRQNGMLDLAHKFQIQTMRELSKNIEPRYIGRNHIKGQLDKGFYCGDLNIFRPDLGPCSAEYHLASDLFPTERKLLPISESRRVYVDDPFFGLTLGDLFGKGTTIYQPISRFVDLDDDGRMKKEVGLRHLAAYLYNLLGNLSAMNVYNDMLAEGYQTIKIAFEQYLFVLPKDDTERVFYENMIKQLIDELNKCMETMQEQINPMMLFTNGYNPDHYKELVKEITKLIKRYKGRLFEE